MICSIVAILVMSTVFPRGDAFILECFETWSRCSGWSSGGTGWLWKSCQDRCEELGYSTGTCESADSNCRFVDKAYQCRCYGKTSGGSGSSGGWWKRK
uniref:Hydramacin n=1 Tax=Ruditapes philippinarum TaxID=129788 RepID=A0A023HKA1_RUDPH|nr:hydramacin [Ruditapes philippinarum]